MSDIIGITCISHQGEVLLLNVSPMQLTYEQGVSVASACAQILVERRIRKYATMQWVNGQGKVQQPPSVDSFPGPSSSLFDRPPTQAGASLPSASIAQQDAAAGSPLNGPSSSARNMGSFLVLGVFLATFASIGNYYIVVLTKSCALCGHCEAILEGLLLAATQLRLENCQYIHRTIEFVFLVEELLHGSLAWESTDIAELSRVLYERPLLMPLKDPEFSICEFKGEDTASVSKRSRRKPDASANSLASTFRSRQRPEHALGEVSFTFGEDGNPDDQTEAVPLAPQIIKEIQRSHKGSSPTAAPTVPPAAPKELLAFAEDSMENATAKVKNVVAQLAVPAAATKIAGTVSAKSQELLTGLKGALSGASDQATGSEPQAAVLGAASTFLGFGGSKKTSAAPPPLDKHSAPEITEPTAKSEVVKLATATGAAAATAAKPLTGGSPSSNAPPADAEVPPKTGVAGAPDLFGWWSPPVKVATAAPSTAAPNLPDNLFADLFPVQPQVPQEQQTESKTGDSPQAGAAAIVPGQSVTQETPSPTGAATQFWSDGADPFADLFGPNACAEVPAALPQQSTGERAVQPPDPSVSSPVPSTARHVDPTVTATGLLTSDPASFPREATTDTSSLPLVVTPTTATGAAAATAAKPLTGGSPSSNAPPADAEAPAKTLANKRVSSLQPATAVSAARETLTADMLPQSITVSVCETLDANINIHKDGTCVSRLRGEVVLHVEATSLLVSLEPHAGSVSIPAMLQCQFESKRIQRMVLAEPLRHSSSLCSLDGGEGGLFHFALQYFLVPTAGATNAPGPRGSRSSLKLLEYEADAEQLSRVSDELPIDCRTRWETLSVGGNDGRQPEGPPWGGAVTQQLRVIWKLDTERFVPSSFALWVEAPNALLLEKPDAIPPFSEPPTDAIGKQCSSVIDVVEDSGANWGRFYWTLARDGALQPLPAMLAARFTIPEKGPRISEQLGLDFVCTGLGSALSGLAAEAYADIEAGAALGSPDGDQFIECKIEFILRSGSTYIHYSTS